MKLVSFSSNDRLNIVIRIEAQVQIWECSAVYWAQDNRKRLVCAQYKPFRSERSHATTWNRTGWDGIKCVDCSTTCNRLLFPLCWRAKKTLQCSFEKRMERTENATLWKHTHTSIELMKIFSVDQTATFFKNFCVKIIAKMDKCCSDQNIGLNCGCCVLNTTKYSFAQIDTLHTRCCVW